MPRHYPNWLKAYANFTRASEAPEQFHFWTGVATIAGALRRRVSKEELIFQWTPNFYIVLVSPAGVVTKSTSIGLGINLLRQVDGVHFGPESMTWQFLQEDFAKAAEYVKYYQGGEEKTIPMAALTISISELGTFLRTDDSSLMSFLTRMWDGQKDKFAHGTRGSGKIEVENPWLNVIGATTPTWLRNNFPERLIGEGLTSRVVFVYGETKRHFVAYPSTIVADAEFHEMEGKLVEDLKQIATLAGPYRMTNEALLWGERWYKDLWAVRPVHLASERFSGYLARKQTHLHKLAIILAASKRDELRLELEDLVEADIILTETEKHMIRVFESMGVVEEAKHIGELKAFVQTHGMLTADQLWRLCMNIMSQKDFLAALRIGVESGIFDKIQHEGKNMVKLSQRRMH